MTCLVKYLRVGQCRHLECIAARSGRLAMIDFPSFCGLIQHPHAGWILFDTGYAEHFFTATAKLPQRLYRTALPINLPKEEVLLNQLTALGLTACDISAVIVSHYHGDHVAGLRDFPRATFFAGKVATQEIQSFAKTPWQATLAGKLPGLLPDDFEKRINYIDDYPTINLPEWMQPFSQGFDLLGDASLIAISLPGHSAGQMGLLIPDADGRPVFMAADACWSLPACKEGRLPSVLTNFFAPHGKAYEKTFIQLGQLAKREPEIRILPSHCESSWRLFKDE
ncbi:MAG: MBL fold metallo-hydrolase [Gammaproteobacteria bacterium]|nr:MAG: MBL fold metallo-hydrolase [Gammaproteobacteria bacterium]